MEEITVKVYELTNEEILKHIELLKDFIKVQQKEIKQLKKEFKGDEALLKEISKQKVKDVIRMCEDELIRRKINIERS